MEKIARATQEWEKKNKGANAYQDELRSAKKTTSSKFSNRPQSVKVKDLTMPKAEPVFIATIKVGRQHMRISNNDSHNMKTNNGYGRKANGGFYRIM